MSPLKSRKSSAIRGAIILAALLINFTCPSIVAAQDDQWQILRQITHRRSYKIVDRQSNCISGKIIEVTDSKITIKSGKPTHTVFERGNVLRIADNSLKTDVIYSARSSWLDVKALSHRGRETLKVITNDGKRVEGKLIEVTDDRLVLQRSQRRIEITKGQISQVFYVRYKPLSSSAEHAAQELYLIDPELWPYFLNIGVKIPVRLYDASLPEDNTPIVCNENH